MTEMLNILVAEPNKGFHDLLRLFLRKLTIYDHRLFIHSAYQQDQALAMIKHNKDFALIISSSKFKRKNDGLFFLAKIRKDKMLNATRIIYHIHQGDLQPKLDTIKKLEINCFRKTHELTQYNFFNEVHTSLRDFITIQTLNETQNRYQTILDRIHSRAS